MPSLYVHYKFGNDVLANLPKELKDIINQNIKLYHIFNQGNDNLYYYQYHWQKYKSFGIKIHHEKVNLFFQNALTYLKENHQADYGIIYAYINHYVLDTLLHPLINSLKKSEKIDHTKIEYLLDYYLYGNKMWSPSYYNELIPRVKFDKELRNFLKKVYYDTYNVNNIDKIINQSHNNAYYLYRYFIYDRYGKKANFYKLFEKIAHENLHDNTFYIQKFNSKLLNEKKNEWRHPKNADETYTYSFHEIYEISLKIAVFLDKLAYDVIYNNENIKEFLSYINLVELKNIAKFPL